MAATANVRGAFEALRAHVFELGLDWPITLSCNGRSEVWIPTRFGPTPLEERDYLEDESLDTIVQVVLEHQPTGGRFVLDDDGLYLKSTESWVEWNEWVSARARHGRGDQAAQRKGSATPVRSQPKRIATRADIDDRLTELRLHQRAGNVHNPKPSPLSQGGDT